MSSKINNIEGLSPAQIRQLVKDGGEFVVYKYCISIIVMSFNRNSEIYFIHPDKNSTSIGIKFFFISIFFGWWGIPWGPIYTIGGIYNVLTGGTDLTHEVMSHINQTDPEYGTGNSYNIPGQNTNNNSENTYNIPGQNTNNNSGSPYNIPT